MEVTEVKMLRFSLRRTRMDRIRKENIRRTAHVRCSGEKVRLRWFGHEQRRDSEYICRRMMRLDLTGRRPGGRPERRFMDVVKQDLKVAGVRGEDADDGVRWRRMIHYGNP